MTDYRISFPQNDEPATRLANALKKRIEDRWQTKVSFGAPADLTIGYEEGTRCSSIEPTETGYRITGTSPDELWNAAGRLLRSASRESEVFIPAPEAGKKKTEKALCGMYFATHFHNYYHDALIDEVKTYVEDLALWGLEVLEVWFDMHHYTGMDDPAAVQMADSLKAILSHAKSIGLKVALTMLANEGFSTTPEAMKASNAVQNGYFRRPIGFYHTEICPHAEGGMDLIRKTRREMLEVFASCRPDYYTLWPYDQGGCTCKDCSPWGSNGFITTAREVAKVIRSFEPNAKIVLSTWYFGQFHKGNAEWDGLYEAFENGSADFADMILADFPSEYPRYVLENPPPRPLISFNEISMYGMSPWGGFGANPMPGHILEQWNDSGSLLSGGFPYSEGIFEDINKAMTLRLFREGADPYQTGKEYLRYECGWHEDELSLAEEFLRCIERGHKRDSYGFQHAEKTVLLWDTAGAERAEEIARTVHARMTERERGNIKWRLLYLRTKIDGELVRNEGVITEKVSEYCAELDRIYATGKNSAYAIRPFCREQLEAVAARVASPAWKGAPILWWEEKETDQAIE